MYVLGFKKLNTSERFLPVKVDPYKLYSFFWIRISLLDVKSDRIKKKSYIIYVCFFLAILQLIQLIKAEVDNRNSSTFLTSFRQLLSPIQICSLNVDAVLEWFPLCLSREHSRLMFCLKRVHLLGNFTWREYGW